MCFPLNGEFVFYLKNIYFLENHLESSLIFVLFFKKKKTVSLTSYLKNVVCEKPNMDSMVRLLIGDVL